MPSRHPIRRGLVGLVLAAVAAFAIAKAVTVPRYAPGPMTAPPTFESFYEARLAASRAAGVRPGNEERLVRAAPGRTPLAILYIHGYGASRAEGEEVMDRVAAAAGANLYYLRLPGHGTTKEDQRAAGYRDFLETAEEALAAMPLLGERVVVAGSSMGGLIATWLAANHPDRVAALALAAPFYDFADPVASTLFALPGGRRVIELIKGKVRSSAGGPRDVPGWEGYWYREQYFAALQSLADLTRLTARRRVYARVRCPVLLLYHPHDRTASVAAMRRAFAAFGGTAGRPPASQLVAIADGDHVLLSRWVRSDRAAAERALTGFLRAVAAAR